MPSPGLGGEDGRRIRLAPPKSGVQADILNNDDPGFRQYLFDTVRRCVTQLGDDGIFWDSGAQPMPPDFTDRGDGLCSTSELAGADRARRIANTRPGRVGRS